MEICGLEHFNNLVGAIKWTPDYPIAGINFADLSQVFGHPSLAVIARLVAENLCIEKGQIVLGVPTRGIVWATVLANAAQVEAVYLQKKNVGTALPDSIPFAESATIYNEKKTGFTIRAGDVKRLTDAHIVWVMDDCVESGTTLATIRSALWTLGCKDVRLLPLLTFTHKVTEPTLKDHLYSVIESSFLSRCYPGKRVFSDSLDSLFVMRGIGSSQAATLPTNLVYGPPSMSSLVIQRAAQSIHTQVGDVNWQVFDGGMPNVTFEMPTQNVTFIYDASWDSTVQDSVVHAIARNCPGKMTVVIPFLPQGTCERTDKEGVLATAQSTLFSLCANMPITGGGPVDVVIYDVHQTGSRFFTTDRVRYVSKQVLGELIPEKVDIIAFPDAGAYSRFKHLFTGKTLLVFSKIRQDGKRKICLAEKVGPTPVEGATICIVDDLVRTGGTILECATILTSLGAGRIGAAFVHCDFDLGKTIPFVTNPLLDFIVTTDSNPKKARALVKANPTVTLRNLFGPPRNWGSVVDSRDKVLILASSSETKLDALRKYVARNKSALAVSLVTGYEYRGDGMGSYSRDTTDAVVIYTGPVPSYVSEQPLGAQEAEHGVKNRVGFVRNLFASQHVVVAFESAIEEDIIEEDEASALPNAQKAQDQVECSAQGPVREGRAPISGPFVDQGRLYVDVAFAGLSLPHYPDSEQSLTFGRIIGRAIGPRVPEGLSKETPVGEQLQKLYNLPTKDAWIAHFPPFQSRVDQLHDALLKCVNI